MGVRFHRRIKLASGISLNVSKSGLSLSVGMPGASLNLSADGASASLGIPGTGLSYRTSLSSDTSSSRSGSRPHTTGRQVNVKALTTREAVTAAIAGVELGRVEVRNPDSGRRVSIPQLNSLLENMRWEHKQQSNAVVVEQEAALNARVVDGWRNTPHLPDVSVFREQLQPREFQSTPVDPNKTSAEQEAIRQSVTAALQHELEETFGKKRQARAARLAYGIWFGIAVAAAAFGYTVHLADQRSLTQLAGAASVATVLLVGLWPFSLPLLRWLLGRRVRHELARRCEMEAPQRLEAAYREFQEKQEREATNEKEHRARWESIEQERVERVRQLLGGDIDAINATIHEKLAEIDAPFDMECEAAAETPAVVYCNLDLPEMASIIPEKRKKLLSDGSIKEIYYADREWYYRHAVIGLAYRVAAEVFATVPTVRAMHIAGFTQRVSEKTGNTQDECVFEIEMERTKFGQLSFQNLDPFEALSNFKHRIKSLKSGQLKAIDPPSWLAGASNDTA